MIDQKKREEKKLFAAGKMPSMKRRDDYNNYCGRKMYMITIEVEGRRPLLGTLTGAAFAPQGSSQAPRVELSPLGQAVSDEWMGIPRYYPQIEVMGLQVMPDHLHGILFVHEALPVHLGHVIGGFKTGCNRILRTMAGCAAAQPQPTPNKEKNAPTPGASSLSAPGVSSLSAPGASSSAPSVLAPSVPSASVPSASSQVVQQAVALPQQPPFHPLFAPNYNDLILKNYEEFQHWKNYLADNPRRLMLKRQSPALLRPFFGLKLGPYTFSGIGNRELLRAPQRIAVRVSRRITGQDLDAEVGRYMCQARNGAVLVSPAISPGEKRVMRAAFDAGLPTIVIMENGLAHLSKPHGEQFYACAAGRLLMLSAWEHHNDRRPLTAFQCYQMNLMAITICEPPMIESE